MKEQKIGNQLQRIVQDSGLEKTKAQYILDNFQDYFKIASEWEIKAKTIVVSDEFHTAEMQMARSGRLFLRDKRIAIEKSRKALKEQSLRESKAIDGIANVLKALLIPIEEYLDKQEHFVEIRKKAKEERERVMAERKIEAERIAREKTEAEEQERIRLENIRLRLEAEERELLMHAERKKAAEERRAIEDKARKAKEAAELKEWQEREKIKEKARQEREALALKAKEELAEKARCMAEEQAQAAKERERLLKIIEKEIQCPKCNHKFRL